MMVPPEEYISGEAFLTFARSVEARAAGVVYCKTDFLDGAGEWRGEAVPRFQCGDGVRVLLTGHSDLPVTPEHGAHVPPTCVRWFGANMCAAQPRMKCLPLGLSNATRESDMHVVLGDAGAVAAAAAAPKPAAQKLLYANFSVHTHPAERQQLVELLAGKEAWATVAAPVHTPAGRAAYLAAARAHKLVACPRGNGVDTHRLWEALYLGCVPVVLRHPALRDFEDLPILFLDAWAQAADPAYLEARHAEIVAAPHNLAKLTMTYWKQAILAAATAGRLRPDSGMARTGQVTRGTPFGDVLCALARRPDLRTFYETGTWNGQGSTACLMDGVGQRADAQLFSAEISKRMHGEAAAYWAARGSPPNLHLLYGRLAAARMDTEEEARARPLFHKCRIEWWQEEAADYAAAPVVGGLLPAVLDLALLDGGEFSTEAELDVVLARGVRVVALDDSSMLKTSSAAARLGADPAWQLIAGGDDRNGWRVFERIGEGGGLVARVKLALRNADVGVSKLSPAVLGLPGWIGTKTRHFYNSVCAGPGVRYLEVGCYKGSSTAAALYGNPHVTATVMDLWLHGTRAEFMGVAGAYFPKPDAVTLVEGDCFEHAPALPANHFNVYLYDGGHSEEDHYRGIKDFWFALADEAVILVDDFNWADVRNGTRRAFAELGIKPVFSHEVYTQEAHAAFKPDEWWNGTAIFIIRK